VLAPANCSSGLALAKLTFELADYLLLKLTFQLVVLTTDGSHTWLQQVEK